MKQQRFLRAWTLAAAMALCGSPLLARSAAGAPEEDGWRFAFSPYLWASGMEGEAALKGLPPQPVEMSFGDVWSNLDFAALGAFEARRGRLGIGTDLVFMNLGAKVPLPDVLGHREPGIDVRQLMAEADVFYRAFSRASGHGRQAFVDVLAGARYSSVSAQLETSVLPDTRRSFGWVEAVVGARGEAPLSRRLAIAGRADAAIGSEVSWQFLGDLKFRVSQHWRIGAGYRYAEAHHEEGEGSARKLWSMTSQGPYFGAQVEW